MLSTWVNMSLWSRAGVPEPLTMEAGAGAEYLKVVAKKHKNWNQIDNTRQVSLQGEEPLV